MSDRLVLPERVQRVALRRVRLPTLYVAQPPPCRAGFDAEGVGLLAPGTRRE